MLNVALAVLVWKNLLSLKIAEKIDKKLGNKQPPLTIKEIIKVLKEAEKEYI